VEQVDKVDKVDKVEIVEKWYCNRVERYVRMRDGSLAPLDVLEYLERPFVKLDLTPLPPETQDCLAPSPASTAITLRSSTEGSRGPVK
jgi:hypothetical protein